MPDPIATADQVDLWDIIAKGLKRDGDFAVREHFAASRPVYTWEDDTPPGLAIKHHPDGRRELVRHCREGDEIVRVLIPRTAPDAGSGPANVEISVSTRRIGDGAALNPSG